MKRQLHALLAVWTSLAVAVSGCAPTQPFFFFEDGDLSHYVGMATDIEHPDVKTASLAEVEFAGKPFTVTDPKYNEIWELSLQDAVRYALENSKVMRSLGGRQASFGGQRQQQDESPEFVLRAPQQTPTVYDPALQESSVGETGFGRGVEDALSVYDAQLLIVTPGGGPGAVFAKTDRPQNTDPAFRNLFQQVQVQDQGVLDATLSKRTRAGGRFEVSSNSSYLHSNSPTRDAPSDWTQTLEIGATQPLLRGAGTLYNGIAGPLAFGNVEQNRIAFDGVVLARIRTDISLADFEAGIRNLVNDVEGAYWNLYFAYRNLEARKVGRDSAFATWNKIQALRIEGSKGGEADKEAQAREQYFFFRNEVETALSDLFRAENRLRYIMGLAATDGRLIAPISEPTTARVEFDWREIHAESIARNVELRQQRWRIKQRELELLAAKNHLMPELDLVARYRWFGLGDQLLNSDGSPYSGLGRLDGTDAFSTLLEGDFQESEVGLVFGMPVGFRKELARVRHHQLLIARERAILQDQELELSHQLTEAVRVMDTSFVAMQTNFNRVVAARDQVDALESAYRAGTVTVDLVLDAQRRLADALSSGFRSQADYNRNIAQVHFRKGSLLEYNDVYLAEGPWPAKAYFDAHRRARARDAAYFLDYGFTRPDVISRGPINSQAAEGTIHDGMMHEGEVWHDGVPAETLPTPAQPTPASPPNAPPEELPSPGPATMRPTNDRPQFSQNGSSASRHALYETPAESTSKKNPAFDWKIDRATQASKVGPSSKAASKSATDSSTPIIRLTAGEMPDTAWRDANDASPTQKAASPDGWKKAKK